ncbi:MAG: transposase [Verrucomicrobia bacterium]|nr:transposase [Verrucomicrobiota bacterium]
MFRPAYLWRQLTPKQQADLLAWRKDRHHPWHSPPHRPNYGHVHFFISGACYEHEPHIGLNPERMDQFSEAWLELLSAHAARMVAWCVLPNHYHALVETPNVLRLLWELGRFHGRTAHAWNGEENKRGRQVFHRATERFMRSERHFWATVNYVHNNPVHHRYVKCWTEWPWSSAQEYLHAMGRDEAARIWKNFPIRDYGKGWDAPEL